MAGSNILQWIDGRGWLVFSGGAAVDTEIRARVLARATADGGVAYISINAPEHASALEDMDDLGAPAGYLVDVLVEDDDMIRKHLKESGIVVVEDTRSVTDLHGGLLGAAIDGMRAAFEKGAIVLVEGAGIAAFGKWLISESGEITPGLEWIANTLIVPTVASLGESEALRAVGKEDARVIAIGIGPTSALALGPDGQIELWGDRQVTIALGPGYQT
jgi:hypothetical protein